MRDDEDAVFWILDIAQVVDDGLEQRKHEKKARNNVAVEGRLDFELALVVEHFACGVKIGNFHPIHSISEFADVGVGYGLAALRSSWEKSRCNKHIFVSGCRTMCAIACRNDTNTTKANKTNLHFLLLIGVAASKDEFAADSPGEDSGGD